MKIHDLFFWLASFFLIGVFFASLINLLGAVVAALLLAVIFLFFDKRSLAALALFVIVGAGYYWFFDYRQNQKPLQPEGTITVIKLHQNYQELIVAGQLKIIAPRQPQYQYGDYIKAEGEIKKSRWPLLRGRMSYPKIKVIAKNQGHRLKATLINFRLAFENNLKKVLPIEKAALLTGITLGSIEEISKKLDKAMKASGTTHITALSGSNLNIIIALVANTMLYVFRLPKRRGFWLTIAVIIAFVIMTGAEASLLRAAIMGFIILLSQQVERIFSLRNALASAALLMVFFNPKILTFDLGFQLSFLAILGLGYLQPLLEKNFRRQEGLPSPLKNYLHHYLWPTLSAQLAVLPLLLIKFKFFNPLSIIANILILPIIPHTMMLGFVVGSLGFVSYNVSLIAAWLANILLTYEIWIINLFAAG